MNYLPSLDWTSPIDPQPHYQPEPHPQRGLDLVRWLWRAVKQIIINCIMYILIRTEGENTPDYEMLILNKCENVGHYLGQGNHKWSIILHTTSSINQNHIHSWIPGKINGFQSNSGSILAWMKWCVSICTSYLIGGKKWENKYSLKHTITLLIQIHHLTSSMLFRRM